MNNSLDIKRLYGKVTELNKAVYCLKKYVQDHSGGGGEYRVPTLQEVIESEASEAYVTTYGVLFQGGDFSKSSSNYLSKIAVMSGEESTKTHNAYFGIGEYENGYLNIGVTLLNSSGIQTHNTYYGANVFYKLTSQNAQSCNFNTGFGSNSMVNLQSGNGHNTTFGYESGKGLTTGGSNTFLGSQVGRGITTGSNNTIIGRHANLPATTNGIIALYNGAQRLGFKVDTNGTTTIPAQTNALIDADTTGKSIVTKEYLSENLPTSDINDIDRLSLFDQNSNEIGYHSLSTSSGTAKGDYSVALGRNSESNGNYSMVMGALNYSNYDYTHLLGTYLNSSKENQTIIGRANATSNADIILGIGEDDSSTKNALEVYSDGRIIAPSINNTIIDNDTSGKSIVTKEYLMEKVNQMEYVVTTEEAYNSMDIDDNVFYFITE